MQQQPPKSSFGSEVNTVIFLRAQHGTAKKAGSSHPHQDWGHLPRDASSCSHAIYMSLGWAGCRKPWIQCADSCWMAGCCCCLKSLLVLISSDTQPLLLLLSPCNAGNAQKTSECAADTYRQWRLQQLLPSRVCVLGRGEAGSPVPGWLTYQGSSRPLSLFK